MITPAPHKLDRADRELDLIERIVAAEAALARPAPASIGAAREVIRNRAKAVLDAALWADADAMPNVLDSEVVRGNTDRAPRN